MGWACLSISFGASVIGSLCGIGGGIIIKPLLEFFRVADLSSISFLSSCTVFSMACYNVGRHLTSRSGSICLRTGTPLALGAVAGGLLGNRLFSIAGRLVHQEQILGAVQALCLLALLLGTMVYCARKPSIPTHHVKAPLACVGIGLLLGTLSSFLSIGGGPFNLVVLHFFFSMPTKTAAANSLYIIFFSQASNLIGSVLTQSVPPLHTATLVLMILGGIGGGIVGHLLNRGLNEATVDRSFQALLAVLAVICCFNAARALLS